MSAPAPTHRVAAVLLAAGRGARMGGPVPKAFLPLDGTPIVVLSARRLAQIPGLVGTVLVVNPDDRHELVSRIESELQTLRVTQIIDGGETRQGSVTRGVAATAADAEVVVIHDAARPFFPVESAVEAVQLAASQGGAILAIPARDTLKEVDADCHILRTVPRERIWLAQTPQAFRRDVIVRSLAAAAAARFDGTDDAAVVERFSGGTQVLVVPGSPQNLKITTPGDLVLARQILDHARGIEGHA